MDTKDIRYVVFMLNPDIWQYMSDGQRIDTHDGQIFTSLNDAKEYAIDAVKSKVCTRFVIGMFVINRNPIWSVSCVETYGFKHDRKSVYQMELFTSPTKKQPI